MVKLRRIVLACGLVCAVVAFAASTALGTLLRASPAGAFSASTGSLTFTSSSGEISCPVTFSGTLAAESSGTLTESPRPESNPQVGSFTSGSSGRCSSGRLTLLPAGATRLYVNSISGRGESELSLGLYAEHVTLLVDAFSGARCQYDARLTMTYSNSTGSASIVGLTEVRTRALFPGTCPERPNLRGTLSTAPRQIIVDRIWRCQESRLNEINRVEFPLTTPGMNVTQGLTCRNESGNQLTVAAGSAISGADATKFNLPGGPPATGTNIAAGNTVVISINFAPPLGTPAGVWQAEFDFNTTTRIEPFPLRGST
jgi:hypothetical protein